METSFLPLTLARLITFLLLSGEQGTDFVYFVQQWPGSVCDTKISCCYPKWGKPSADFSIHGLWPNNKDGSYPSFCNPDDPFDLTQIVDLMRRLMSDWPSLACPSSNSQQFWKHEWEKHGTCAKSIPNQHAYFETTLNLKNKANLLNVLKDAGIKPNNGFYSYKNISNAIQQGVGYLAGIQCNKDERGNSQLNEVFLCLDSATSGFINCPKLPISRCDLERIQFPSF